MGVTQTRTLWRHPDFVKLWVGQIISELGSRISLLGLPMIAARMLNATPPEMGVLAALNGIAILFFALPVGVWVDRVRRRPVMIGADIGRAVLLSIIPWAAWRGSLTMTSLYVVAALTGILAVCFDVAYQSYLPTLVDRDRLLEANSKLAVSTASAEIAGFAITGMLIELISAPFAILLDAISFLWSAVCVALVRKPEPAPGAATESHWKAEILGGLHSIRENKALRALAGRSVMIYLFFGFFATLYLLYSIRDLKMGPGLLGLIVATGGIGSMLGALFAERISTRFGLRRTFVISSIVLSISATLIPLASGSPWRIAAFLIGQQLLGDCAMVIFMTNEITFRQRVTPDELLGRVNAAMQILSRGVLPVGALAGGVIAEITGIRGAMAVAAAGIWLSNLWLFQLPRQK